MKTLLIICGVILLLQFAVLGLSLTASDEKTCSISDEDDIDRCKFEPKDKYPLIAQADSLLKPFRKRVVIIEGNLEKRLAPNEHETVVYDRNPKKETGTQLKRTIVELMLKQGDGMMVSYSCDLDEDDGFKCSQKICLCSPGAALDLSDYGACGDAKPKQSRCPDDGDIGQLVVYTKTGELNLRGVGRSGGSVKLN